MTTRTFSPEQQAYLVAKAVHEELNEQVTAILKGIEETCGPLETEEAIDAYCEQEAEVRDPFGMLQVERQLREAEQALLRWGIEQARRLGVRGENMAALEALAVTPMLSYRERALDLIMRLDAAALPAKRGDPA